MHYDTFSARLNVNNPTISTCKLDLEMLPSPGFSHFTSHFIYYQTISLQQEDISLEIHVKKKKKEVKHWFVKFKLCKSFCKQNQATSVPKSLPFNRSMI